MSSLALAMIVRDGEKTLPRLFKSIVGCFDRVYVTDTGSKDKTLKVAENFGCEISHFKWCDDFSAARNFNFSQVKEDYVMWMDSDDVLGDKRKFLWWKKNMIHQACMWLVPYIYTRYITIERERVVKNHLGYRWKYPVHECIDPCLNGKILPAGIEATWGVIHTKKHFDGDRNFKIMEKNQDKMDGKMKYYYGRDLICRGDQEKGGRMLREAIADPELTPLDKQACKRWLRPVQAHFISMAS
jgi:glycosyltransferase involved in cell wall biosynthesis